MFSHETKTKHTSVFSQNIIWGNKSIRINSCTHIEAGIYCSSMLVRRSRGSVNPTSRPPFCTTCCLVQPRLWMRGGWGCRKSRDDLSLKLSHPHQIKGLPFFLFFFVFFCSSSRNFSVCWFWQEAKVWTANKCGVEFPLSRVGLLWKPLIFFCAICSPRLSSFQPRRSCKQNDPTVFFWTILFNLDMIVTCGIFIVSITLIFKIKKQKKKRQSWGFKSLPPRRSVKFRFCLHFVSRRVQSAGEPDRSNKSRLIKNMSAIVKV